MVLSCKEKEAVSCAEDALQVRRRSHGRRCYYGPASDAEFLRSIADKTPGREDQINQVRRRQVYLKSYVFVTKDDDELRRRHHQQQTTTGSSSSRWWCAKKAGKVMSHVLNRLLACRCNIDPVSDSSSSHAGAAAMDVHLHSAS